MAKNNQDAKPCWTKKIAASRMSLSISITLCLLCLYFSILYPTTAAGLSASTWAIAFLYFILSTTTIKGINTPIKQTMPFIRFKNSALYIIPVLITVGVYNFMMLGMMAGVPACHYDYEANRFIYRAVNHGSERTISAWKFWVTNISMIFAAISGIIFLYKSSKESLYSR